MAYHDAPSLRDLGEGISSEDVHAVGTLAPLIPGYVGCVVIRSDGSRRMARVVADPLTQQR